DSAVFRFLAGEHAGDVRIEGRVVAGAAAQPDAQASAKTDMSSHWLEPPDPCKGDHLGVESRSDGGELSSSVLDEARREQRGAGEGDGSTGGEKRDLQRREVATARVDRFGLGERETPGIAAVREIVDLVGTS